MTPLKSDTLPRRSLHDRLYSGLVKLLQMPLAVVLIPSLIAGSAAGSAAGSLDQPVPDRPFTKEEIEHFPGSVRKLLRKPRVASMKITRKDGTQQVAQVLRVTDRFLAIRDGGGCQNVPLSSIADVKTISQDDGQGIVETLLFVVFTSPVLAVEVPILVAMAPVLAVKSIRAHDPFVGDWESAAPASTVTIQRVSLANHEASGQEILIRKGSYHFADGSLTATYDDGTVETFSNVRFDCDEVVMDGPSPVRLKLEKMDHAGAPIIGRWRTEDGNNVWEFRADGKAQKETILLRRRGEYFKTNDGFAVQWTSPGAAHPEQWPIRYSHRSLYAINGHVTTELKPRVGSYQVYP